MNKKFMKDWFNGFMALNVLWVAISALMWFFLWATTLNGVVGFLTLWIPVIVLLSGVLAYLIKDM